MSPGPRFFSPVLSLAILLLAVPPALRADKVYLKSGEVVSGNVIEETPDVVRIQVLRGTIKDKRTINRISIDRVEKTTPEDVEREACLPLKTTPDGLPAKNYEERLKTVNEFLTKYPASTHLAEIQGIRDSLNAELEKVKSGQTRFRGNWLSPEQQAVHVLNLEAYGALRVMRQAAAGGNLFGALRQFEMIERVYPGTLAYPAAVTDAKNILPAYGRSLTQELEYARYEATQNAKGLASLPESARAAAQQEIAAAAANFKALVEAEKAKKITWLSVDLKSEPSINEAIARVRKEMERVAKLDAAALEEQAKAFYDAGELIHAGKLEEAKAALTNANMVKNGAKLPAPIAKPASSAPQTTTGERPSILAFLQQQLDDRVKKKIADDKLAAAAEAEKTAKAAESTKPTETAPLSGDDALNALVMQRTASAPAPGKDKPAKGAGTSPTASGTKASTKPSAPVRPSSAVDPDAPARPAPVIAAPRSSGSPLPFIVGGIAVCLVGATTFLFIQERKKQQGG
ncbi:MAG: hypothetical protein KGS60_14460 [Verrucomicrobia bacterium]|nr:hypothetical protein [Verrucomicrobiota bacterium]